MSSASSNNSSHIILLLFGLVFLGAGLGIGYFLVLSDFNTWFKARAYIATAAELLDVKLISHRGEETTTYQVQAQYRYSFQNKIYLAKRVSINSGADNIGTYQQKLYASLRGAQQRREQVTAWVDPNDPNNALLDRNMRWGLFGFKSVFFLLFTVVGLVIVIAALQKTDPTLAAAAQRPWLTNPAWRDGRITSTSRGAVVGYWCFAIVWNLISAPLLFLLSGELHKNNWPALLGLLFPIVGAWLIYGAVYRTLQWRRFGCLTLTMNPFPGTIGGEVAGVIDIPERFDARQKVSIVLTCVHRIITHNNRDHDNVSESAIWQDETQITPTFASRGTQLPFRFRVPTGLPPSAEDSHRWTLRIAAELPGIDLNHTFELPVFESAMPLPASSATPTPSAPPEIPASIVRIERKGDGAIFYYPPFRSLSMSLTLAVFGLIFGGAALFMSTTLEKGLIALPMWLMMIVMSFFAAMLLCLGFYTLFNSLRVEISARGVITTRRMFGFEVTKQTALEDIVDVKPRITSQSHDGKTFHVRYTLDASTRDQRRVVVGDDVPGHPLAEYLAQQLREAIKVK